MDDAVRQSPLTFGSGSAASAAERERMAQLLFETSYLEYGSAANTLGVPPRELQRRVNIDPWLAHIRVLYDAGRFAGFYNAAPLAAYAAVAAPGYYRAEIQAIDAAYDRFVSAHVRTDELFVASLAVDAAARGRGLLGVLMADIATRARALACGGIALTVWRSSAAHAMYERRGYRERGVFDAAYPLYFDRLHCMAHRFDGKEAA